MERKLASVQKIVDIIPIEGADKIELARVEGWQCVIAKSDNFKIGDLGVYLEIDSLVDPNNSKFEFLKERKYRVRTIKLRGQLSQGLFMPLSILPNKNWKEGDDVTELLKVRKYDPIADAEAKLEAEKLARQNNKIKKFFMRYNWFRKLFPKKKAGFPYFISKTDEERIQNMGWILQKEKGTKFVATEKVDGQSGTYFLVKNKQKFLWFGSKYIFGVCSRNLHLPKKDNSNWWNVAKKYNIKSVLEKLIGEEEFVVLQGEITGPTIQGNKYKLGELNFQAFNLLYPNHKIDSVNAKHILDIYNIKFVPILSTEFVLPDTMDEALLLADGKSVLADTLREGLVLRNYEKDLSFKIVSNKFLLKFED